MKISREALLEILKENWCISAILDYSQFKTWFDEPREIDFNLFNITLHVKMDDGHEVSQESTITFDIDATEYDEKFSDVNTYEVEDMGVIILISNSDAGIEDLTPENTWKNLFLNKEQLS